MILQQLFLIVLQFFVTMHQRSNTDLGTSAPT